MVCYLIPSIEPVVPTVGLDNYSPASKNSKNAAALAVNENE
jgi:hypothetical protein